MMNKIKKKKLFKTIFVLNVPVYFIIVKIVLKIFNFVNFVYLKIIKEHVQKKRKDAFIVVILVIEKKIVIKQTLKNVIDVTEQIIEKKNVNIQQKQKDIVY